MNFLKIALFCLIVSSLNAFGQNFGQNNNGFNNGGMNRDIGNTQQTPSAPSPEEIQKFRTKKMDEFMKKLKVDLTLDELQIIAIRQGITTNNKNIDVILKKEDSDVNKEKEVKALMEKNESIINSYLNKDQKVKYKALVEDLKNNNTKEKKSKKKNQDKEKVE